MEPTPRSSLRKRLQPLPTFTSCDCTSSPSPPIALFTKMLRLSYVVRIAQRSARPSRMFSLTASRRKDPWPLPHTLHLLLSLRHLLQHLMLLLIFRLHVGQKTADKPACSAIASCPPQPIKRTLVDPRPLKSQDRLVAAFQAHRLCRLLYSHRQLRLVMSLRFSYGPRR